MTRRLEFTVPPAYDGRKVVHFLRGEAGCSYTLVRSLKTKEDGILLNGARARTIDRLAAGGTGWRSRCATGWGGADRTARRPCRSSMMTTISLVYDKPAGMA